MPGRKVMPEVQRIFEKYAQTSMSRRMAKKDAVVMLENEFALKSHQAELLFDHGKLILQHHDSVLLRHMHMWEFQHFYNVVGVRVGDIVEKFESLDTDCVGHIQAEVARSWIELQQRDSENPLGDKQLDFLVKVTVGDDKDGTIDLVRFADLLTRFELCLKQHNQQTT